MRLWNDYIYIYPKVYNSVIDQNLDRDSDIPKDEMIPAEIKTMSLQRKIMKRPLKTFVFQTKRNNDLFFNFSKSFED